MRKSLLTRCLLLACVLLPVAAGVCQAEIQTQGEEENYRVVLVFDKGRPVIGTNQVRITVTDPASQRVTGARVKVDYFMPSLMGKPPMMGRSTKAVAVNGAYEANLKLSMKGEWRIVVSVAGPAKTEEVAFTYEVK